MESCANKLYLLLNSVRIKGSVDYWWVVGGIIFLVMMMDESSCTPNKAAVAQ